MAGCAEPALERRDSSVGSQDQARAQTSAETETTVATTVDNAMRQLDWSEVPPFIDDGAVNGDWSSLRLALERQLRWLERRPQDRQLTYGPRKVAIAELRIMVKEVLSWLDESPSAETFGARIAHHFDIFESVGKNREVPGDMLVTGYYIPEIEGSLDRRPGYNVPIYRHPGGMVRVDLGAFNDEWKGRRIAGVLRGGKLEPFPDRQQIRSGVAELRGREIGWAKDPVDLFFIEVQGSGVLRLPDGNTRRIGYAGANGRAYRSIGSLLINEGKVPRERMSMQAIRSYLAANPDDIERVLDYNQSFVFFRYLDGPPVGNLGFPVTAERSIAVDQKLFPQGALSFLITDRPQAGANGETIVEGPMQRFVLAQDTGGAIKGAGRADFFWGPGQDAAARAGVMKQPGRLLFIVPRQDALNH